MRKKPYRKADALIEFVIDSAFIILEVCSWGSLMFWEICGDHVLRKLKRVKHEL